MLLSLEPPQKNNKGEKVISVSESEADRVKRGWDGRCGLLNRDSCQFGEETQPNQSPQCDFGVTT